jgi:hypothetical protein
VERDWQKSDQMSGEIVAADGTSGIVEQEEAEDTETNARIPRS